ncbi:unnamed protein product [Boreogadus saida]
MIMYGSKSKSLSKYSKKKYSSGSKWSAKGKVKKSKRARPSNTARFQRSNNLHGPTNNEVLTKARALLMLKCLLLVPNWLPLTLNRLPLAVKRLPLKMKRLPLRTTSSSS